MSANLPSRGNRAPVRSGDAPGSAQTPPPPPPPEAATPTSGQEPAPGARPGRGLRGGSGGRPNAQRQTPTQRDVDRPQAVRERAARRAAEPEQRTVPSATHRLRRSLNSPRALRQAILLREVLGPPVSLRRPGDDGR